MKIAEETIADWGAADCPLEGLPQLKDWQLVRQAGRGSWSCVYQARPRTRAGGGPADYAVKMLAPDLRDWRLGLAALQREAEVAGEVAHENLLTVLMQHVSHPPYYTVTPFLYGKSLRELLDRGCLPTAAAWKVARQVAAALHALHGQRWLHADVKPDNILVSRRGHVTLIDLGLARRLESDECDWTAPQVGTAIYMAPELREAYPRYSAACDIYSLGVTLREMLGSPRTDPLIAAMVSPEPGDRPRAVDLIHALADRFAPDAALRQVA